MSRRKIFSLLVACVILCAGTAQARIYILIDQPSEQRFPIAIKPFPPTDKGAEIAEKIQNLLIRNLQISGYFEIIPPSAFLNDPTPDAANPLDIDWSIWKTIGAEALIKGRLNVDGNRVTLEWRLYDPNLGTQLVGKEYQFKKEDYYKAVHKFSNEVILALTGSRGIFETRIAAACGPQGKQQIVSFYPDGTGHEQLTANKTHNLSPEWSPDGSKIAYTSYTIVKKAHRRPDLYLLDVGQKKSKSLSSRGTLNITPAFSPTGDVIAYSNTVSGDPEIYLITLKGDLLGRLTNSWLIDLSPTWSPDGSHLIFSSERGGNLHLFKTDRSGGNVERLTFVGYHNDQAAWAPTGDKIAFTSRDKGRFDIFIMNPDGSRLERLTNQEGNNESPSWSPDGRYLVFSSTRTGRSQVYIMRWDGADPQLVNTESCTNPDWAGWEQADD